MNLEVKIIFQCRKSFLLSKKSAKKTSKSRNKHSNKEIKDKNVTCWIELLQIECSTAQQ